MLDLKFIKSQDIDYGVELTFKSGPVTFTLTINGSRINIWAIIKDINKAFNIGFLKWKYNNLDIETAKKIINKRMDITSKETSSDMNDYYGWKNKYILVAKIFE